MNHYSLPSQARVSRRRLTGVYGFTLLLLMAGCASNPSTTGDMDEDTDLATQGQSSQNTVLCTHTVKGIETNIRMTEKDCADAGGKPYAKTASKTTDTATCAGSRSVLVGIKGAQRISCDQGIIEGTIKYESTAFYPASEMNDELVVTHQKLVDPEYYYPHQNISVGEQLKSFFTELNPEKFSDDTVVKTGFASMYKISHFTIDEKQCFGFTKHTRQSLSTGFFCRSDGEDYEPAQIKQHLSKLAFR